MNTQTVFSVSVLVPTILKAQELPASCSLAIGYWVHPHHVQYNLVNTVTHYNYSYVPD